MKEFKLPDLGEGLQEAEIVQWHVRAGETVKVDQPLLSVETAKAITEIPCPRSGTIASLHGRPGDVLPVGSVLVVFTDGTPTAPAAAPAPAAVPAREDKATVVGAVTVGNEVVREQAGGVAPVASGGAGIKAMPAVRALAQRLNVDLTIVTPTGPDGLITAADVERVHRILANIEPIEPLRGVRRVMAANMAIAHAEVVNVTVFDDADIDGWPPGTDFTVRMIRALLAGTRVEPRLNSWYDAKAMGVRILKAVHLGIAVDVEEGLFVPVIKDAQDKSPAQLRAEINRLKKGVADRSLPGEDLRGHTIALTNFGTIAGRYGTPIVTPPTVAILGAGRSRREARVVGDQILARRVLPLSLTFDHRAINGGEAARFLAAAMADLELPT